MYLIFLISGLGVYWAKEWETAIRKALMPVTVVAGSGATLVPPPHHASHRSAKKQKNFLSFSAIFGDTAQGTLIQIETVSFRKQKKPKLFKLAQVGQFLYLLFVVHPKIP